MKPLKHIVAVIAALVLAGCASTKPVEEPNYALLALTDLGIVAGKVDDIDGFWDYRRVEAYEWSFNFRKTFPVEEVIKQTLAFDEYIHTQTQEAADIYLEFYDYIRFQNAALEDETTAEELKIIYQRLAQIKARVEIFIMLREQQFATLYEMADKYNFPL
jgi:hypothetical protein